jgi:two-component system chemotaxis sensor kinase CheA
MSDIADDGQLMQVFYRETQGLIGQMRQDLSSLTSEDRTPEEQLTVIRRLFRCAHIVKSSAGTVGFDRLEKVSQALERMLKAAADGQLTMTPHLLRSVDQVVQVCGDLLSGKEVKNWESLMESLKVTVSSRGNSENGCGAP